MRRKTEILPGVEHRQSRYLNNRAEVSHQPTRRRERHMQRFKSARYAQRFLSSHSRIHNHFQLRRHRLTATAYRTARDAAFRTWREVTGIAVAAGIVNLTSQRQRPSNYRALTVWKSLRSSRTGSFERKEITQSRSVIRYVDNT